MKKRNFISLTLTILFVVFFALGAQASPDASREYQIKAAFLFNFIKFIDWPEEKMSENGGKITIGIVGKDPFENAFEPLKDKLLKGKKVEIIRFKSFSAMIKEKDNGSKELRNLKKCNLLFICSSEKKNLTKIVETVKNDNVLTVGDTKGFLESGGIINLVMEKNKVRFEINIKVAQEAGLKIRSKLLSLAKRVIKNSSTPANSSEYKNQIEIAQLYVVLCKIKN